jgi:hypothetical protein
MNPLLLSLIVMVVISGGAAHRYDGRSFAIGEGVVVAVGDEFRDGQCPTPLPHRDRE